MFSCILNSERQIQVGVQCYLNRCMSDKPKLSSQLITFYLNRVDLNRVEIGFFTLVHEAMSPADATIERLHLRNWEQCNAAFDVLCSFLRLRGVKTVELKLTQDCFPGVDKKIFKDVKKLVGNALQSNHFTVIPY